MSQRRRDAAVEPGTCYTFPVECTQDSRCCENLTDSDNPAKTVKKRGPGAQLEEKHTAVCS